ncbi:RagB/SusD family nutrient uptake outer membrane protein [Alkaliflexus imshenetskii]|uniref:RagB/SusD family nutrient uptake outer membrane protein n=1 Tax=Alkaliflexus imshenetskii TaxID=286730 RepID=UPI0004789059|nr:RagB/SusD family nutrient uptake outer membrane protein [Alkaliflexus imshenetskii]
MKAFKYLLFLIIFGGIITSCEDELDVFPRNQLTPNTITSDDVQLLMNGVYATWRNPITFFYLSFLTEDLSSDNLVYRATFFQHGEVDNNAILTNNVLTLRYYNGPYSIIQTANDVVNLLEVATAIPEESKKLLEGEARYLRAYAYYKLVTLFGGVPIIESRDPDMQIVPRSSEADVWQYIIDDLVFAVNNAAAYKGPTLVSKEAAKALLSRVYLIRGNNGEAKRLADEVIASNLFALSDNYDNIWVKANNDKEHIFYINHTATDGTNSMGFFLRHSSMVGSGRAELPVDLSLIEAYEEGDTRKDASVVNIPTAFTNPSWQWFAKKFRDPGDGSSPFIVSRIAEMYLISAEAQFKISNNSTDEVALGRINAVRQKRGLAALTTLDLHKIIHERRVELAFEGTRWTDMKRTPSQSNPNKSMALVYLESKGRTTRDLVYPIPDAARDVNPLLEQNPGY